MRQRVAGVKEPWWRPMLRCPCFWGEKGKGWMFCPRIRIQRLLGREPIAGRLTAWSLR